MTDQDWKQMEARMIRVEQMLDLVKVEPDPSIFAAQRKSGINIHHAYAIARQAAIDRDFEINSESLSIDQEQD